MQVKVYAKLNLSLLIGKKLGNFHQIDSIATSVDVYDVVQVTRRHDSAVTVSGVDQVETDKNTAYKAAVAFTQWFGTDGVDISVVKGIPFGGGLGGSSADAAAVIYCMCKLFEVSINFSKVKELCSFIGCDVYFMLHGGLGRMQGAGNDVYTIHRNGAMSEKSFYFALTTFNCGVSSKDAYGAFDLLPCRNGGQTNAATASFKANDSFEFFLVNNQTLMQTQGYLHNSLQDAVRSLTDYAEEYIKFTSNLGWQVCMTGSGSAYFIPFDTLSDARKAAALLNANGFATTVCQSMPQGIEVIEE